MFEKQKEFARNNVILTSAQHIVGGFGLAILVQYYSAGDSVVPVIVGWILVGISIAVHVYEFVASRAATNIQR